MRVHWKRTLFSTFSIQERRIYIILIIYNVTTMLVWTGSTSTSRQSRWQRFGDGDNLRRRLFPPVDGGDQRKVRHYLADHGDHVQRFATAVSVKDGKENQWAKRGTQIGQACFYFQ